MAEILRWTAVVTAGLVVVLFGPLLLRPLIPSGTPCGPHMVWAGRAGEIEAGLGPDRVVRWGARSYTDDGGWWLAAVLIGGRVVDRVAQDSPPHRSFGPRWGVFGQTMVFLVYHVDTHGHRSLSRLDAHCVIP